MEDAGKIYQSRPPRSDGVAESYFLISQPKHIGTLLKFKYSKKLTSLS